MTDLAELILFCIIGRILIYLWMEFPLPRWADNIKFIHDVQKCDLCSGVYAFTILFWIFNVNVLQMLGLSLTIVGGKLINSFVGGAIISYAVHLITIGYRTKFSSIVIE